MTPVARLAAIAAVACLTPLCMAQVKSPEATASPSVEQQPTPAALPAAQDASPQSTPSVSTPDPKPSDPVLSQGDHEAGNLPATGNAEQNAKPVPPKVSEKEQRKRDHDADKAAREKEKDATYLKLQGNEIVAPTLDADGKPIELAPCARKDKECQKKRKALLHRKKVGLRIENGTLTVDGWTSKARLNYDISEIKFLYISIPGQGTVIASMEQFPNSAPQKNALAGKTLTLQASADHTIQISSDETLVDKKEHVIYVALDPAFTEPGRFPTLGYGSTAKAPYNWPGVRPLRENEEKISAKAPPLPSGMAIGQMKLPCQKVLPGERPKPVKINGIVMTPEPCPVVQAASTSETAKKPISTTPPAEATTVKNSVQP